ncbi:hypothetical protein OAG62_01170 [bacterium]|nr:hypothetical protein [bacterium]
MKMMNVTPSLCVLLAVLLSYSISGVATEAIAATGSEEATAAMLGHTPSSTVVRRYSTDRLRLATQASRSLAGET